MKRRKFQEYGALGSTSFLLNLELFKKKSADAFISADIKDKQLTGADLKELKEFTEFFNHSMIHRVQHNEFSKGNNNLSGLGMLLPKGRQDIDKYRYLQIFSDLKLVELFDTILFH